MKVSLSFSMKVSFSFAITVPELLDWYWEDVWNCCSYKFKSELVLFRGLYSDLLRQTLIFLVWISDNLGETDS